MASLLLGRVTNAGAICLGSHTKYITVYLVFLNHHPLLFDILALDMMII